MNIRLVLKILFILILIIAGFMAAPLVVALIYKEIFEEIGHEWFHLGQLFSYLKQNGVALDMGAYYGYKDPDPDIPPNK